MEESSLVEVPKSVELEEGEKTIMLVRQHWYVFRNAVLIALFIPFCLLFGAFMVGFLLSNRGIADFLQTGFIWLSVGSLVFGTLLFFWHLFLWRGTFYLLTDKRIILVTRYGMFHHDDRETGLAMIQDVRALVDGMEPSLYGFGDVTVQVSSEDAKLVLEKVPKPREVQRVIIREAHLKV